MTQTAEAKRLYNRNYRQAWRARNPERAAAAQTRNAARRKATEHPLRRQARLVNHSWRARGGEGRISGFDILTVLLRDHGSCVFCGAPTTEIDHDIPASRGGRNELANIQLCCHTCNARKRTLTGAEFRGEVPTTCPQGHPRVPENRVRSGRQMVCLPCRNEASRRYSQRTRERANERRRARVLTDPDYVARMRAYRRAYEERQRAAA